MAGTTEQNSQEFTIKHDKLDLHIYLSSSNKLLLHEETIPDRVAELKCEFLRDQMVNDPIVIDADSSVVLDGMHRVVALRELNCTCVPVCAVDYLNPSIKVGVWYRTMFGEPSPSQVKFSLSTSGLASDVFPFDMTRIYENPTVAILFENGECYRITSSSPGAFEALKIAEQCVRRLGFTIKFETEHDALQILAGNRTKAIMTLPRIDKESVRKAGLTGQLLPHKVTRHIIPARPLGINVPLKTLTDQGTQSLESNRSFVSSLQKRSMTRGPSGTIVRGRRYEEETFIFS